MNYYYSYKCFNLILVCVHVLRVLLSLVCMNAHNISVNVLRMLFLVCKALLCVHYDCVHVLLFINDLASIILCVINKAIY